MSESYTVLQTDTRTLGTLQARLLDDLNRPDLTAQSLSYIQDSIRYYQRKPFFANLELDNTSFAVWAPATIYPQGSTIQVNIAGTLYAIVALVTGQSGLSVPVFPTSIFTPPGAGVIPPPPLGTPGTVIDNTITWGTIGLWAQTAWTQLSTVYSINQYLPPIDYQTVERIEITIPNLRYELLYIDYGQLRDFDVIRAGGSQTGVVVAYPTNWAWYQQQIYVWPYPNGFYPLTISYRGAPQMINAPNQTNYWTTLGEAMIRADAAARIRFRLLHDRDGAQDDLVMARREEASLRSLGLMQRSPARSGIPPSDF
jgi:hypothetical protein